MKITDVDPKRGYLLAKKVFGGVLLVAVGHYLRLPCRKVVCHYYFAKGVLKIRDAIDFSFAMRAKLKKFRRGYVRNDGTRVVVCLCTLGTAGVPILMTPKQARRLQYFLAE
jgi:hypothetical protein